MPRIGSDRSPTWALLAERLRRGSVWLLMLAALSFLAWRTVQPQVRGAAVIAREKRVLAALRTIHRAQLRAAGPVDAEGGEAAGPGRLLWLSDLVAAAEPGSALKEFTYREQGAVELLEGHGYVIALYLRDDGNDSGKAWSRRSAVSPDAGNPHAPGAAAAARLSAWYAAFAWPAEFGPDHRWAFYIDHRGKLLGSWNPKGLYNGLREPFPPTASPLREYLDAARRSDDSEWFLFQELGEMPVPSGADAEG